MANLITLSRLLLLFILVGLLYHNAVYAQIIAFFLLILIFVMDGLDGWVARRRGESSLFGAIFDIAADRVVENVLWVVLADLDRVPIAVALLPTVSLLGFDDEWFHRMLLVVVLPVSVYALYAGLRKHGDQTVLRLGLIGLLILIVTAAFGHDLFGETGERIVTVIGSVLVALGHWRNFQLCKTESHLAKAD